MEKVKLINYIKCMHIHTKGYYKYVPLMIVLSAIVNGFSVLTAYFSKIIIDTVTNSRDFDGLVKLSIIIIFSYIIYSTVTILYDFTNSKLATKLDYKIKLNFFDRVQRGTYLFNIDHSSADIYYRMFNDISVLSNFYLRLLTGLISNLVMISSSVTIMFFWSKILTIFVLLMCIVQQISILLFRNPVRKMVERQRLVQQDIVSSIDEHFKNIETIKTLGVEKKLFEKMKLKVENVTSIIIKNTFIISLFNSISGLVSQLWSIGILVIGGGLLYSGDISIGILMGVYMLSGIVFKPISDIANMVMSYQEVKVSYIRFIEYNENINSKEFGGTKKFVFNSSLKISNVSFSYNRTNKNVLENINIKFYPNEITCIVGKSGIGKSTIGKLILRILFPSSGNIYIDNVSIYDIELKSYRERVAYLPQRPIIMDGSLLENIVFGYDDYKIEVIEELIYESGLKKFLDRLPDGINTKIGTHGFKVSEGEMQRIALCRIMLRNPKIIILDEPTASLDTENEKKLMEIVTNFKNKHKCLIIIITHKISTMNLADKIINLENKNITSV